MTKLVVMAVKCLQLPLNMMVVSQEQIFDYFLYQPCPVTNGTNQPVKHCTGVDYATDCLEEVTKGI